MKLSSVVTANNFLAPMIAMRLTYGSGSVSPSVIAGSRYPSAPANCSEHKCLRARPLILGFSFYCVSLWKVLVAMTECSWFSLA